MAKNLNARKKFFRGVICGLAGVSLALVFWSLGWLETWEAITWDWRASLLARSGKATDDIRLILVDQYSRDWAEEMNEITRPWPRELYGLIINFCQRSEVRALAFDVPLNEFSKDGVADDEKFGATVANFPNFAGAISLGDDIGNKENWLVDLSAPEFTINGLDEWLNLTKAKEVVFLRAVIPIPELAQNADVLCNVQLKPDFDGVYRQLKLFNVFDNKIFPTLGLGTYLVAHRDVGMQIEPGKLTIGEKSVPIDKDGNYVLRYRGSAGTYISYSAAEVLQAEIRKINGEKSTIKDEAILKDLKNKYVLFGDSDTRSYPTPVGGVYSSVKIHATIFDNLLSSAPVHAKEAPTRGQGTNDPPLGSYEPPPLSSSPPSFGSPIENQGSSTVSTGRYTYSPPFFSSPASRVFTDVEIHATMLDNILSGDFIAKVPIWLSVILISILTLICGILASFFSKPLGNVFIGLVGILLPVLFSIGFYVKGFWLPLAVQEIAVAITVLVSLLVNYTIEGKQKWRIKNAFQHNVLPVVVDHMLEIGGRLVLEGKPRQMTVLSSGIQDFTTISEMITRDDRRQFLNKYYTMVIKIVESYEGVMVEYSENTTTTAFYGTSLKHRDHAIRACKTAVNIMTRLYELRDDWEKQSLPFTNIEVGISSGETIIGNRSAEKRFDYTIRGNHVNVASPLEKMNKRYGTNIIFSQFTYDAIRSDPFIFRELDTIRVQGKGEPIRIYELLGDGTPDQQTQEFLTIFQEGLDAYKGQRWYDAIELFRETLYEILAPKDDLCCRMYIERCKEYKRNPPPKDWDGIYNRE